MKLRDKFWLWGHPEGAYNNGYGNSSPSRMTPMEACLYLGVRNTFMTPMEIPVDRRQYNKSFVTLRNVAWDIGRDLLNRIGDPAVVEEYLANIKDFPNITASVFDDFKAKDKYKNVPVQALEKIMDRLHNNNVRHIDSWMVLYTHEFGVDEKSACYPAGFQGRSCLRKPHLSGKAGRGCCYRMPRDPRCSAPGSR